MIKMRGIREGRGRDRESLSFQFSSESAKQRVYKLHECKENSDDSKRAEKKAQTQSENRYKSSASGAVVLALKTHIFCPLFSHLIY